MQVLASIDLPSQAEIAGRILLAAVLGGLIGLEREASGHPAGLRTHIRPAVPERWIHRHLRSGDAIDDPD